MKKQVFAHYELYCKNCEEVINVSEKFVPISTEDINDDYHGVTPEEFKKGEFERMQYTKYCDNCISN